MGLHQGDEAPRFEPADEVFGNPLAAGVVDFGEDGDFFHYMALQIWYK